MVFKQTFIMQIMLPRRYGKYKQVTTVWEGSSLNQWSNFWLTWESFPRSEHQIRCFWFSFKAAGRVVDWGHCALAHQPFRTFAQWGKHFNRKAMDVLSHSVWPRGQWCNLLSMNLTEKLSSSAPYSVCFVLGIWLYSTKALKVCVISSQRLAH